MTTIAISNLTLTDAFRHAVDGMFIVDRNRQVVYFSEGCERITGARGGDVVGSDCACHGLADCQDEQGRSLSGTLCPAVQLIDGLADSARHQHSVRHRDGHRIWIETTYSPIRNSQGEVTAVAGVMRDITKAKEREFDLQRIAGSIGNIDEGDASMPSGDGGPLDRMLTAIERKQILTALDRADGQRTLAARTLGISRSRLYRRMEALRIDPRGVNSA